MSNGMTTRERWFMTAVPAMVVLAVYVFGIYRPQQTNMNDAQQRLSEARSASVTQNQVILRRQAARSLQGSLDAAKKELSGNPSKPPVRTPKGLVVSDETRGLSKITDVFKGRGVLVVASTRVSDSDALNAMPVGLGEVVKNMPGPTTGAGHGSVWRMEMVGSFGDLRASMTAIDALEELVVPLCVSMEPSQDSGPLHHWTLWFWM